LERKVRELRIVVGYALVVGVGLAVGKAAFDDGWADWWTILLAAVACGAAGYWFLKKRGEDFGDVN